MLKEFFLDFDIEVVVFLLYFVLEEGVVEELLQIVVEEESCLFSVELEKLFLVNVDSKFIEEKIVEVNDRKVEFLSSGSNLVLNIFFIIFELFLLVIVIEGSWQQFFVIVLELLVLN